MSLIQVTRSIATARELASSAGCNLDLGIKWELADIKDRGYSVESYSIAISPINGDLLLHASCSFKN